MDSLEDELTVFLVQIFDRPYGFRVAAIVAKDEPEAMKIASDKYGAEFGPKARPYRMAEISHRCL